MLRALIPQAPHTDDERQRLCLQLYRGFGLCALSVPLFYLVPHWHWQLLLFYGRSGVMALLAAWRIMQYDDAERERRLPASRLDNCRTNVGGYGPDWMKREVDRCIADCERQVAAQRLHTAMTDAATMVQDDGTALQLGKRVFLNARDPARRRTLAWHRGMAEQEVALAHRALLLSEAKLASDDERFRIATERVWK